MSITYQTVIESNDERMRLRVISDIRTGDPNYGNVLVAMAKLANTLSTKINVLPRDGSTKEHQLIHPFMVHGYRVTVELTIRIRHDWQSTISNFFTTWIDLERLLANDELLPIAPERESLARIGRMAAERYPNI